MTKTELARRFAWRSEARTVLLVEEDSALREVCTRFLVRLGYDVVASHGVGLGLHLLRKPTERIVAVLSDIETRSQDAVALLAAARSREPAIPVLLLTGDVHDDQAQRSIGGAYAGFLKKPFTQAELDDALSRLVTSTTLTYLSL